MVKQLEFKPCLIFYNSKNKDYDGLIKEVERQILLMQCQIPIESIDVSNSSNDDLLAKYGIKNSDNLVYVIEHGPSIQKFYQLDDYLEALKITMKR